jgi:L-fuconolactonase
MSKIDGSPTVPFTGMQTAILDTHVHLWDPDRFEMPWLAGDRVLEQRYDLARFDAAIAGTTVAALVYVQVEVAVPFALLEAEEVVRLAQTDSRIRAMVPWAPLEYGQRAEPYIERLLSLGPLTTSVRRLVQDEPDPEFCLRPRFVEGIRLLASYDLGFDLCVRHAQLPAVTQLVELAPNVRFVLDHSGKPDIRSASIEPWRQQIQELARRENVVCKLSGLVTEANHAGWKTDDLRPYVETVLEAFGPMRIMFGGDWPVVLLASSYRRWLDVALELTAALSPAERSSIFWGTGSSFYRL